VRDTTAPPKSKGVNGQAGLRFVARQPVFDRAEKVFGYELLFRDGSESVVAESYWQAMQWTRQVSSAT